MSFGGGGFYFAPRGLVWLIMEDNDPAGFKSGKGKQANKDSKMRTMDQPPYSPDLNPLHFSIWSAIEKEALATRTPREKAPQYTARLKKVALGLARDKVKKAVEGIRIRAQKIFEADGQSIKRD